MSGNGAPERSLVVGVTGHRSAGLEGADLAVLAASVASALESIRAAAGVGRLTVISPLAEGADRIVARAALDSGHALVCALPFPRDAYARDFPTAASRADYRALLSLADSVHELNGATDTVEARDAAYAAVGAWVLDRCDVLLAVWDGKAARGIGGAGSVVNDALAAGLPVVWVASRTPHDAALLTRDDGNLSQRDIELLGALLRERSARH